MSDHPALLENMSEDIEFVGGPFCGVVLMPHMSYSTSVHEEVAVAIAEAAVETCAPPGDLSVVFVDLDWRGQPELEVDPPPDMFFPAIDPAYPYPVEVLMIDRPTNRSASYRMESDRVWVFVSGTDLPIPDFVWELDG